MGFTCSLQKITLEIDKSGACSFNGRQKDGEAT